MPPISLLRRVSLSILMTAIWLAAAVVPLHAAPPVPPSPGAAPNWGYTFDAVLPAKTAAAKNLVVLIHGADSNPAAWADGMRTAIQGKLTNQNDWDLFSYDWHTDAAAQGNLGINIPGTGINFNISFPNQQDWREAQVHGQELAKHILNQSGVGGGYEHVHFIGHSLGGRVIQSAVDALMQGVANNNNQLNKMPIVQSTFLDAFTPTRTWQAVYGRNSTWAEHYYSDETTTVSVPIIGNVNVTYVPSTQSALHHAANFDVTAIDPDPNRGTLNAAQAADDHQWAHQWYRRTVDNHGLQAPNQQQQGEIAQDRGFGFPLSKEAGHAAWGGNNTPSPLGKLNVLPADAQQQLPNPTDVPQINLSTNTLVVNEINRSATGTIALPGVDDLDLSAPAGSTAWINLEISVPQDRHQKIDFFKFNFDFTSAQGADGLLSFYLDLAGQNDNDATKQFFDVVERFAVEPLKEGNLQQSFEIVLPKLLDAGKHVLSIRLDSAAGTASSVELRDLMLGSSLAVIPEPASWILALAGAAIITLLIRRRRFTLRTR